WLVLAPQVHQLSFSRCVPVIIFGTCSECDLLTVTPRNIVCSFQLLLSHTALPIGRSCEAKKKYKIIASAVFQ
ncbi:hypothetical protein PMAYCL1PPCAC_13620, partial [Pristionchus mayeri]